MEEIVKIMPQNYTAMNNLAYLLADNQELDKALEYARKAVRMVGNPVSWIRTLISSACLKL